MAKTRFNRPKFNSHRVLNKKILVGFIREERDTSQRYHDIGVKYDIPTFIEASKDEKKHADKFSKVKVM